MKQYLALVFFSLLGLLSFAQAPNLINYQAVIRDANGDVLPNKAISLRLAIYEGSSGGIVRYEETHSDTTNNFGLFNLMIGSGTPTIGTMDSVRWGQNIQVLVIDVDLDGGTNWERLNTSQLVSVPYALHASTASFVEGDNDRDSTNELQTMTLSNDTLFLSDGGFVVLNLPSQSLDNDTTNELIQSVTLTNDTLFIQEPFNLTSVNLSSLNQSGDISTLSARITNDSLRLNNLENDINLGAYKDSSATNELQVISISNDTLFLTNGGFAVIPSANTSGLDTRIVNDSLRLNAVVVDFSTRITNDSLRLNASIADYDSRIVNDSLRLNALQADVAAGAYKDSSATNEIQALSISNDTIFLSSGGFVVLPSGAVNNDNDSTNELITSVTLTTNTLTINEPNNVQTVDLSSLNQSSDLNSLLSRFVSDSSASSLARIANADSIDQVAANLNTHVTNDGDLSATNEIQVLSISNDTIFLTSGGFAVLPSTATNNDNDSTNELITSMSLATGTLTVNEPNNVQTVDLSSLDQSADLSGLDARFVADSSTSSTARIANADSIDQVAADLNIHTTADNDLSATNEIQVLSISNDTIFLTGGGFAVLPASAVNNDNDSTNELITSMSLAAGTLTVNEPNNVQTVDLSGLDQSSDLSGLTTRYVADSTASSLVRISNADSIDQVAADLNTHTTADNDLSATNEIQVLSISNDTIFLTSGGFAVIPASAANNDNDSTNELITSMSLAAGVLTVNEPNNTQNVNLSTLDQSAAVIALDSRFVTDSSASSTSRIANADSIDQVAANLASHTSADNDLDSTNEIQVISISNDTIFLTDGGFAILPAGTSNNDNDSTNEYVDSLYLVSRDLILSQSGGLNLDTTDLSLVNYWNESSGNLSYIAGNISIGATSGTGPLSVTDSTGGRGIISTSIGPTTNIAIDGIAQSSATNNFTMTGLLGRAIGTGGTSGTGFHYGVFGTSTGGAGTYGAGVYGQTNGLVTNISRGVDGNSGSANASFNQGVFGFTNQSRTSASGYNAGIGGEASGHSSTNYAVIGLMPGLGTNNYGGAFFAYGNVSGAPKNYGAYGYAWGADTNIAVYGYAADDATATNYGVYGEVNGTTGRAGYFIGDVTINGDLDITGAISKGSGTFKIDHPLDPENKYLVHSFVESPEMMNVYNGNVTTDANGLAVVTLPDYFEVSNKDFRYQLTPIGDFAQCIIKKEISGNQFIIATDKPNIKVSWQVTGVRNDPYAKQNRIIPEQEKSVDEKGKYLHPDAYDQDKSREMYPPIDGGTDKAKIEELKKSGGSPTDSDKE